MKVLIASIGTRGDVAPFTGLGVRLREAGHDVAIASYPVFADMVTGCGLEFRPLAGDPKAEGSWTQAQNHSGISTGPIGTTRLLRGHSSAILRTALELHRVAERDTDVMLLSISTLIGYHVAEAVGVPSMGVFLQPVYPTAEHPPGILGIGRDLGPFGNRAAARLSMGLTRVFYAKEVRALRSTLGLPALSDAEIVDRLRHWPVQHAYSPTVLPRPRDWEPGQKVAGYLWPPTEPGWQPCPELREFLSSDEPTVYVGFGSGNHADRDGLSRLVDTALARAGVRGVVHTGWSGLASCSARTINVGDVPHEWLFPRMSAVVHHAGAGTTAAGLRAGVPTVATPVVADQPFWAHRLRVLGAGPAPVPFRKLTVERLAAAVSSAVSQGRFRAAAGGYARALAEEDGAGSVLAEIERLVR